MGTGGWEAQLAVALVASVPNNIKLYLANHLRV